MHNSYSSLPVTESEIVEFKVTFNAEAIETIVAFSNTKGGTVYIGITDLAEVKGVQLGKETIAQWINEIKSKTVPQLIPDMELIISEGKTIVAIRIGEYPVKPVAIRGRYFKRAHNSNHLMSAREVTDMHLQTVNSSWDFHPRQGKSIFDIELEKVKKVIEIIAKRNENPFIEGVSEFLKKYELLNEDTITNGCYLLFSKGVNLYTTIELGHFASETTIKDSISSSTDILTQVDEVISFIKKHINKEIIITGAVENVQRWQYPLEGIRELVLNMIIHRDYSSTADAIVKIFPDYIEFYNPGVLPASITMEQLLSNDYVSFPRNRQIAKIVKEIGWIEKYGTGIKRVQRLLAEHGLPPPSFKIVQSGFYVKVIGSIKTTQETTQETTERIIELLRANPKSSRKLLAEILTNVSEDGVKYHLNKLSRANRIVRVGSTKGGYWKVL